MIADPRADDLSAREAEDVLRRLAGGDARSEGSESPADGPGPRAGRPAHPHR